ncbi:MAG: uracil phosphoribosyltransferase [Myxococcaceae bacterium]
MKHAAGTAINETYKMPIDSAYENLPYKTPEITHLYGPNVHILADPFLLSHLAFLCEEKTTQPAINSVVKDLYQYLIKAVLNGEFPRTQTTIKTRMFEHSPLGVWSGQVLDRNIKTVTVNIVRAGTLPSQVCFDYLNKTLDPKGVRQDHVLMSRMTDSQDQVTGSYLGDSKIGGSVDDAIMLFPDPMGATGSSLAQVISHYKAKVPGKPRKIITVNLIVTPEYLKRIYTDHPEVIVYALRLDRGASSKQILKETPGQHWDQESGLSDKQYILPGGGGFGEIMNNAYC